MSNVGKYQHQINMSKMFQTSKMFEKKKRLTEICQKSLKKKRVKNVPKMFESGQNLSKKC